MESLFVFNPRNTEFKKPFGAAMCGEPVHLSVQADRQCIGSVCIVLWCASEEIRLPMLWERSELGFDRYSLDITISTSGISWYYFELEDFDGKRMFFGKDGMRDTADNLRAFQLTVYSREYVTPSWFSEGVTYHVFVDRFFRAKTSDKLENDSDFYVHEDLGETPHFLPNANGIVENRDIYGGDIDGVREKLPYLEKLGVKTIYLSPIFESWSNHKYDTADYKRVDSHFGSEKSLEKLCHEAEKYGMRIILDGVFSHTGSDSVYFNKNERYGKNGAWNDKDSPYREWYSIASDGSYSCWWGIDTLPQVNELSPSYMDYIINREDSVISYWMDKGVSGWRLDVADELPDEFIGALKKRVLEKKKEGIVIGEVWEDASLKEAYGVKKKYFTEGILDGVMNYPIKNAIIDFLCGRITAQEMKNSFLEILENYPAQSLRCLMNIIGTHDTVRAINELSVGSLWHISKTDRAEYTLNPSEREIGRRRLFQAATLQYMFPGSPCIYYGDEIGMEGFEDPFNRRYFRWDNRDNELLSFYQKLGAIKNSKKCMHNGDFKVLFARGDVIVVMRGNMSYDAVVAAVNRGEHTKLLKISETCVLKKCAGNGAFSRGIIKIPPFSACIFTKE